MKTDTPVMTKLSAYTPYPFDIHSVELRFNLDPARTKVTSVLQVKRRENAPVDMALDGENIRLLGLKIDGVSVKKSDYVLTDSGLTLKSPPAAFSLEIETICNPEANKALMGLYVSGGRFCTQCEAEGFRRITFFPDRPDVMSVYRVRIEAAKRAYPILLANGNCVESGDIPGRRHYAVWEDPFRKPCYLFALVAGEFDVLSDSFTTMSGREIPLDIYVDPGDALRAAYAMDALKRSMKWDEDAYGREYDLDRFMVVAVRDFNFGAMENKGLNIFNSSLLLADEASATDQNFESIESVVAHEYFHNWTGNRITCRDWFQLCLKEGFTVFRDQEFSADQRGAAICRIKDVKNLRARQFSEDAGPLAHAVRPDSYMKIDNFYTATIYEKGAELIRMLKTMLGDDVFRKASDLYFETLDGTAATVEQFITCFERASGQDLSEFMRWYAQAGTPRLSAAPVAAANGLGLVLSQRTPPTPGQPVKKPVPIPVRWQAIGDDGPLCPPQLSILETTNGQTDMLPHPLAGDAVTYSVLQDFSAPVILEMERATADYLRLMRRDPNAFNKWEAGQALALDILDDLSAAIETGKDMLELPTEKFRTMAQFSDAIADILQDETLDDAFKSLAITLPTEGGILQYKAAKSQSGSDPLAVRAAKKMLLRAIAERHAAVLKSVYTELSQPAPFRPDAAGAGRRALRNTCLSMLAASPSSGALALGRTQFDTATNMTEEIAALYVLVRIGGAQAEDALSDFYDKWQGSPLVIDKWFAAAACLPGMRGFSKIKSLCVHPAFLGANPNRIRALIGGFAMGNPEHFHAYDGYGYQFFADNVLDTDKRNPQVAARLLGVFGTANMLDSHRQNLITAQLERILKHDVSANVTEIATKSLAK